MARFVTTTRCVRSLAVLAATAVVVLTGCSSTSATGSGAAPGSASAPLYSALPDSVRQAGKLTIGSSIDYPPFEYYAADGKTLQGFETELGAELEKKLGVPIEWNNANFDTLFTALRGGRYDIVYGAVNDTVEREKTFDFVDYLRSSQGFVVAKGNPKNITTLDDLCGQAVAAVRGGIQAQFLDTQSGACTGAGKPAINVLTFDGNSGEQLAVKQGRAAALLENYPTAVSFATKEGDAFQLVPNLQVAKAYYGMVVNKSSTQLRDTLQKAWQAVIDDGTYTKVLAKWGIGDIAIPKAVVNAAPSGPPGS